MENLLSGFGFSSSISTSSSSFSISSFIDNSIASYIIYSSVMSSSSSFPGVSSSTFSGYFTSYFSSLGFSSSIFLSLLLAFSASSFFFCIASYLYFSSSKEILRAWASSGSMLASIPPTFYPPPYPKLFPP